MLHVNGIDVSDWQGAPNWTEVREAGYSFAYAKATEGIGNTQSSFAENMKMLSAVEMLRGAYHFFDWTQGNNGGSQAEHFLKTYTPTSGDLPPMLDLEWDDESGQFPCSPADAVTRIESFLHVVEPVIKTRCVLYTNFYFWQDHLASTTGFAGHPLWLADYTNGETPDLMPSAWPTATFWQFSQGGKVPGIDAAPADLDRFLGDIYALKAMALKL